MRKPRNVRPYDASARRQRAAETQTHALEIARCLFAERGYGETTMEAIATAAGVAVPTLYAAFGSKRGMLSRLLDQLVSGESGSPSVLQTASAKAVFAEPDRRRALALFARHIAQIHERVGPTYQVMKSAARSEADVAELYARTQRNRFANLEALAKQLVTRGPLRPGLSLEDAGRTIWVLASPESREMLLTQAGWTVERYVRWLGDTLAASLLP